MTVAADVKPPAMARTVHALTVDFVEDLDGVIALRPDWEQLMAAGRLQDEGKQAGLFFQSFAWCHHITRVRSKSRPAKYRVCIAAVRQDGNIVAIWPLSLQKSALAWTARNLDDPFGQFGGILLGGTADPAACVKAVVDALRVRRKADGLHIDSVCDRSPLHLGLSQLGIEKSASNSAPWIDFKPYANFDGYLGSRTSKTRKNLRNALNRLSRLGTVEFITTDDPEQIRGIVKDAFSGRIDWLIQQGKSSTAFRDRDFSDLVEGLPDCRDIGLLGFCITLDGVPIASQWGFVYGTTYYAYISSRNQAYEDCSIGRVHLTNVIESCHQRGITSIELMPPKVDYKMQWTDEFRQLDAFKQSFTAVGHFDIGVLEKFVFPGVKSAGRRLPQGVRSSISALLNRPHKPR